MSNGKIISIYINSLGFGFVVINQKGEIFDYGIIAIRPRKSDKCLNRICQTIAYYEPQSIIVENPEKSNKSRRINTLILKVIEYAKNQYKVFKYSKEQIYNTFEIFGAKNKFEISRKISEMYPEFKTKLHEKRKLWESENYYQGIFDAMSLVFTHLYLTE